MRDVSQSPAGFEALTLSSPDGGVELWSAGADEVYQPVESLAGCCGSTLVSGPHTRGRWGSEGSSA